jgi:hypothetical protein
MTRDEAMWLKETRDAYVQQTRFTDVTDLRDVDRLLALELMVFRWTQWLGRGTDYYGDEVNTGDVSSDLKSYSDQINKIKHSMGLAKSVRDAAANDGNFSKWFDEVKRRAKIFGVHRQEQLGKTIALFNELKSIVQTYDRSDGEERQRLGFNSENDILEWIRTVAIPEFDELDEFFQNNQQALWIREM